MTRVKRGVAANKRRKNVLKRAKGFENRRSTNFIAAKEALLHADKYSYRDRRNKKRDMRAVWLIRLNAALRDNGTTYSKFAGSLKKAGIMINRKMLAELSNVAPEVFETFVKSVKVTV
jgi:large subunit ribosomal protein L20